MTWIHIVREEIEREMEGKIETGSRVKLWTYNAEETRGLGPSLGQCTHVDHDNDDYDDETNTI